MNLVFNQLIRNQDIKYLSHAQKDFYNEFTRARDQLYLNHSEVSPENVFQFLISCTENCKSNENCNGVACALLTLRNESFQEKFLEMILESGKVSINQLRKFLITGVRKLFEFASEEVANNVFRIINTLLENRFTKILEVHELMFMVVSSYDTGCITENNLRIMKYFSFNVSNYQQTYINEPILSTFLLIKFLRFYQDYFVISENKFEEENHQRLLKDAQQLINSIHQTVTNFFQICYQHFPRIAFKEIIRILYNKRTLEKMRARFPVIYDLTSKIDMSYIITVTSPNILQLFLPYGHLSDFLRMLSQNSKDRSILKRSTVLADYDFILSDLYRYFLQSIDCSNNKIEQKIDIISFFYDYVKKAQNKTPITALQALIIDFLYITPNFDPNELHKNITPFLMIIKTGINPSLTCHGIEVLLSALCSDEFKAYKHSSFKVSLNFRGTLNASEIESKPYIKDHYKRELLRFIEQKTPELPNDVNSFINSKDHRLDSSNGRKILSQVNQMIEQLVSEANGEWSNVFSKIFKILDDIIANDRKNIEIIFNSINRIAVAGLMSRKEEDATLFLRWASVNDSEVFKSVSNIVKMSNYTKALIQEIKDQTVYWEPILQKSTVFQQRPGIINAICEYCNSATAFEYATNYNLMHTAIYPKLFSECYQWRSDALFNLSMFINIKLKTPEAIDGMSPTLVEKFEILPQIIIKTLENNMKIVQHKKYVSFLESLEKKGSEKGRKFVLEIRRRWSVMRPLAQKQKPISNKPMK